MLHGIDLLFVQIVMIFNELRRFCLEYFISRIEKGRKNAVALNIAVLKVN